MTRSNQAITTCLTSRAAGYVQLFRAALAALAAVVLAPAAFSQPPACDSLVASWAFNGNALDSSSHGNHGSLVNEVFVPGVQGSCLQLGNPVSAYAIFPDTPSLNSPSAITVAGWYRGPIFSGVGNDGLVSKVGAGPLPYQYHLGVIGHNYSAFGAGFDFDITTTNSGWVTAAAHNWDPGVWYHLVGTYDGAAVKLYVDGVLRDSVPATGTIPSFGGPVFVGRNAYTETLIPGDADEVRIYNRALSAAEIAALYQSQGPGLPVNPATATACPVATVNFTVATAGPGPFNYQWQHETAPGSAVWSNLANGSSTAVGTIAGAATGTLTLSNFGAAAAGDYRCVVSDACTLAVTSNRATLDICAADFDCSGSLGVSDIFDFLAAWFANNPRADFNMLNGIGVQDIFDFLAAWFAGC